MAGYFDIPYLRMLGSVPGALIDKLEATEPGRLEAMIEAVSRLMDSYIFKRHDTPVAEPVPEVIKFRGTQILSHQIRVVIGFDPGSAQDDEIVKARGEAFEWLHEISNAQNGIAELPLREPAPGKRDVTGVSRRKARAFSFQSAVDWHRAQRGR